MITAGLNTKISEVETIIPYASGSVNTTVLNTKTGDVENKKPDASALVKKTDYNAEISDIEKKYFTTFDYNKLASEILDANTKEKGLVNKSDISNLVKNSNLNKENCSISTKRRIKSKTRLNSETPSVSFELFLQRKLFSVSASF